MGTALCALVGAGCDLLDDGETVATINAAHHAGRDEAGVLPNYGDHEQSRIFTNDLGWTITLSDGFVVTRAVAIETCDGERIALETPFGPFPEYWVDRDRNVTDVARGPLPAGKYCKLLVEYGPYRGAEAVEASDQPFPIRSAKQLEGATLLLSGYAERDDGMGGLLTRAFALRSDASVSVTLPLDTIGAKGGPWRVTGDEPNGLNLTVSKTYDRFFAGVDFEALDVAALEAELPRVLREQTGVIPGTSLH